MLITRLISGVILLISFFGAINIGGYVWLILTALIALIGMYEVYRSRKIEKTVLGITGYILALLMYIMLGWGYKNNVISIASISMIVLMSVYVFNFSKYKLEDILLTFFGLFYVAVLFSFLYGLRMQANGQYFVYMTFIGAWGCDTCAYCVGKLFGKHKMAPVLSPKKSVEGSVGGLLGAGILGTVYAALIKSQMGWENREIVLCVLLCTIVAAVSQIGDLSASAIKRTYGIKDFGTLIPGHGGILDSFDSILFAAPMVYWMIKLF